MSTYDPVYGWRVEGSWVGVSAPSIPPVWMSKA